MAVSNVKTIKVNINGKLRRCVTISELASMCSRSVHTMRKYEERKVLPVANFRINAIVKDGKTIYPGERIYTIELAEKIKEVLQGITQGVPATEKQKQLLRDAFEFEKLN